MSKEAFVYLWYDAPNDMYYLGKHKGLSDDTYTHSSTIWEHFTKDNIPEGVTREILDEGTDEEMCVLEHELLVEAKNGGDWDRYYNQSLGDPRYVDQSGENNPRYKHGLTCGDFNQSEYEEYRRKNPETRPAHLRKHKKYYAKNREARKRASREQRAKNKAETGYTQGHSQAKKKAETQGEGTLDTFLK
jgi:hypothetical protein